MNLRRDMLISFIKRFHWSIASSSVSAVLPVALWFLYWHATTNSPFGDFMQRGLKPQVHMAIGRMIFIYNFWGIVEGLGGEMRGRPGGRLSWVGGREIVELGAL